MSPPPTSDDIGPPYDAYKPTISKGLFESLPPERIWKAAASFAHYNTDTVIPQPDDRFVVHSETGVSSIILTKEERIVSRQPDGKLTYTDINTHEALNRDGSKVFVARFEELPDGSEQEEETKTETETETDSFFDLEPDMNDFDLDDDDGFLTHHNIYQSPESVEIPDSFPPPPAEGEPQRFPSPVSWQEHKREQNPTDLFPEEIPTEVQRIADLIKSCPSNQRRFGLPYRDWLRVQAIPGMRARDGLFAKTHQNTHNPMLDFVGDTRLLDHRTWAFVMFKGRAVQPGLSESERAYQEAYGDKFGIQVWDPSGGLADLGYWDDDGNVRIKPEKAVGWDAGQRNIDPRLLDLSFTGAGERGGGMPTFRKPEDMSGTSSGAPTAASSSSSLVMRMVARARKEEAAVAAAATTTHQTLPPSAFTASALHTTPLASNDLSHIIASSPHVTLPPSPNIPTPNTLPILEQVSLSELLRSDPPMSLFPISASASPSTATATTAAAAAAAADPTHPNSTTKLTNLTGLFQSRGSCSDALDTSAASNRCSAIRQRCVNFEICGGVVCLGCRDARAQAKRERMMMMMMMQEGEERDELGGEERMTMTKMPVCCICSRQEAGYSEFVEI